MNKWKIHKDAKFYQTRKYMTDSLDAIIHGTQRKTHCRGKSQTGSSTPQQWIFEVSTDDKDYLQVIADARLQLEKDIAPGIHEKTAEGNFKRALPLLAPASRH